MAENNPVYFHRCPGCQQVFAPFKKHCPNCKLLLSSPLVLKLWQKLYQINWVNYLIIINVFWFALTFLISVLLLKESGTGFLGLPAPSGRLLYVIGAAERTLVFEGHWWRLLSSSFLHGGPIHIGFNLLWLYQLSKLACQVFNLYTMLWLFVLTAVSSSLVAILWNSQPVIGASGAVCGLLVAIAMYARLDRQLMLSRQLFFWLILLLIPGFLLAGISNAAHIGGVLSGGLCGAGLFYFKKYRTPVSWWVAFSLLSISILVYVCFKMLVIAWEVFQAFS